MIPEILSQFCLLLAWQYKPASFTYLYFSLTRSFSLSVQLLFTKFAQLVVNRLCQFVELVLGGVQIVQVHIKKIACLITKDNCSAAILI